MEHNKKEIKLKKYPDDIYLSNCNTYEDYLERFKNVEDYRFIRNENAIVHLVKLNYRSMGKVYTKEVFLERKKAIAQERISGGPVVSYSEGLKPKDPVIAEIASREKPNLQKTLSTIIFVTAIDSSGFEVSSYFDLEDSLRYSAERNQGKYWRAIFQEKRCLTPQQTHLSYFNPHRKRVFYNHSNNYRVIHDVIDGLTFIHKGDHKKIVVGLQSSPNFTKTVIQSPMYGFVKFYDHAVRKKT